MTKLSEFQDGNDKKCHNDNDKIRLVIPGKLSSIGVQLILSTNDRAAPRAEANNLYKCQRIHIHCVIVKHSMSCIGLITL